MDYGSDYVRILAYLGVTNVIGSLGLCAYRTRDFVR